MTLKTYKCEPYDPDGGTVDLTWVWGDGSANSVNNDVVADGATTVTQPHDYAAGNYLLTVMADDGNETGFSTLTIDISSSPALLIASTQTAAVGEAEPSDVRANLNFTDPTLAVGSYEDQIAANGETLRTTRFSTERHQYSLVPVDNRTGTKALIGKTLYNPDTAEVIAAADNNIPDPARWSSLNPNIIYGTADSTSQIVKYDTENPSAGRVVMKDYGAQGFVELAFGNGEGVLSELDIAALYAEKNGNTWVIIYDFDNNVEITQWDTGLGANDTTYPWVDSICISPDSQYFYIAREDDSSTVKYPVYTVAATPVFQSEGALKQGHSCWVYNTDGTCSIVGIIVDDSTLELRKFNPVAGTFTTLSNVDDHWTTDHTFGHVSGIAWDMKGWVLCSSVNELDRGYQAAYWLNIDNPSLFKQVCRFDTSNAQYLSEAHASSSFDGARVYVVNDLGDTISPCTFQVKRVA